MTVTRRLARPFGVLAIVSVTCVAVLGARQIGAVPDGLRVQYFSIAEPDAPPVLSTIDREPSSDYVFADFRGGPPESFTASWNGWVVAPARDTYAFATSSDQESSIEIDGGVIEDNPGAGALRRGTVRLDRGVHSVLIHYVHTGGGVPVMRFLWARDGGPLEDVPGWALRPRAIPFLRFESDRALDVAEVAALAAWFVTLIAVMVAVGWRSVSGITAAIVEEPGWPLLACVAAGSLVISLVGIGWGLPVLWVGDELVPADIIRGAGQHYSHGWFEIYPPVHFYILTAAYLPIVVAGRLGLFGLHTSFAHTLMTLTGRLVSVVMQSGLLLATFLCGRRAFGWRAGLFASLALALAAPFIYYAKTANVEVPYLFWLAGTFVFYLRVLTDEANAMDYVWWAAFGTLAIATKDQAYAICLPMPFVVVYEMWRRNAADGRPRSLARALSDRRLIAAGVVALLLFAVCENVLLNASGFAQHVAFITGRKMQSYRAFAPTLAGRLALLRVTVELVQRSWGWPLFIVSIAGVVHALISPRYRRVAIWLLIPVVSYYVGFIDVVLYNYDRFVMPICFVLALFAGVAMAQFTARATANRVWRMGIVTAALAYTILYGTTVDVLMVRDSRYGVERWIAERAKPGDTVASSGLPRYLPNLEQFRTLDIDRLDTLLAVQPAFVVVNADYTRAEPADSPLGRLLSALRSGRTDYRLALSARSPNPFPWLPGGHPDLVGPRLEAESLSFLRNINPTIEVFARR
jgi:hypothetical protein